MNLLTLTQALAREVGASGAGSITTAQAQTGEAGRLVQWIIQSWVDIQQEHPDWNFLRGSVTFPLVATQASYSIAQTGLTDLGEWRQESFRTYITTTGYATELFLSYIPYDAWRDTYQYGNLRATYSRPVFITELPDQSLGFGPIPDSTGYTVVGEYSKQPVMLSADADTPSLLSKYHMMIVYRAMMHYAQYEAAPEVFNRGQTEFMRVLRRCEMDQLPDLIPAMPLA